MRNHVNNLLEKLNSRDRTEAVTIAMRQNWCDCMMSRLGLIGNEANRGVKTVCRMEREPRRQFLAPACFGFRRPRPQTLRSHHTLQARALLCLILSNTRTIVRNGEAHLFVAVV